MTSCHDYIGHIDTEANQKVTEATVLAFRQGRNDPTFAIHEGCIWRATLTPYGPGTVSISAPLSENPLVRGYGPGGEWLEERALDLLGAHDEIPTIIAAHTSVANAQRRFGRLRIGRSLTPYHELLPTALAQRVTAVEALRQWRELVRDFGAPAPGPLSHLRLPPAPEVLVQLPYFSLHGYGIEKKRADTIRAIARESGWLFGTDFSLLTPQQATEQLQRIPGVGVWTSAVVGGLAFGDADALQVGDFHVKNTAAWALRGVPRGTDEEMVRDMSPYAGQRHRVMRWLEMAGHRAPARGARQRIVSITRL